MVWFYIPSIFMGGFMGYKAMVNMIYVIGIKSIWDINPMDIINHTWDIN